MSPSFNQEKDGPHSGPSTPLYMPPHKRSARSASPPKGPDSPSWRDEKRARQSSLPEGGNQILSGAWRHLLTPSLSPKDRPAAPATAPESTPSKSPPSSTLIPVASSPSQQQWSQTGVVDDSLSYYVPGIIVNAPDIDATKRDSPLLRAQAWVNPRAGSHPLLIWDTYKQESNGELIARCLPMTSFGGRTVEDKYDNTERAWKHHVQYVPIDHQGRTTSRANTPVLKLTKGEMAKQTYIHLDHFFEIETRHLLRHKYKSELHLTEESLCIVHHKLWQFVTGKLWRQVRHQNAGPRAVYSPLDTKYRGNSRFVPFTEGKSEPAVRGEQLEERRYRADGKVQVTGNEKFCPFPRR